MLKRHKGIMIILDGLGDRGIPAFGGKTPLEAAKTPNMDKLVSHGQTGLIDPMLPGLPLATHTATGLLFGLPLSVASELSRGPVEAAGIGIATDPKAIYIRCNLATLVKKNNSLHVIDRRAGRIGDDVMSLASSLGEIDLGQGIRASLHPATQHRAVIKLTGSHLSPRISNTDPGNHYREHGLVKCHAIEDDDLDATRTAEAVNRLTQMIYDRLVSHPINQSREMAGNPPANGIICRSPGRLPQLQTQIHHFSLKTAVVAGEKTVLGLAAMLAYTQIKDPGFTSLPDTNLNKKILLALNALEEHQLVYLHIKAPDICSHDLNPQAKCDLLERFDDALAPLLNDELVICITGDHSTDSNTGRHTGDPVPTLLFSPQGRVDRCQSFGESECSVGGLGRINSSGLLTSMLDQMNVLENYHSEDSALYF